MPSREYVLMLALHTRTAQAAADLATLREPTGDARLVFGSAVVERSATGATVQQSDGGTLAYGIGVGAAAGIVAGVVVDHPLTLGALGALVGAVVGRRRRRREVANLVGVLDDEIPIGAVALVAVVDADRWPLVRSGLPEALRVVGWPLDPGSPLLPFARSLVRGDPTVGEDLAAAAGEPDDR